MLLGQFRNPDAKDEHIKTVSATLAAIDETLKENGQQQSPTAQEQTFQNPQVVEPTALLLSLVFPHLSDAVLRAKFNDATELLTRYLVGFRENAPASKSLLQCFSGLLGAQDLRTLATNPKAKQSFSLVMSFSLDPRPKVRKVALQVASSILSSAPSGHPHPFTALCVDLLLRIEPSSSSSESPLHFLQALDHVLPAILSEDLDGKAVKKLNILAQNLVNFPQKHMSNAIAVEMCHNVLSHLFVLNSADISDSMKPALPLETIQSLLKTLLGMKPHQDDARLGPSWCALIARALTTLSFTSPSSAIVFITTFFSSVPYFASSKNKEVVEKCCASFSDLLLSISPESTPIQSIKTGEWESIYGSVLAVLRNITLKDAWGSVLVLSAALIRIGSMESSGPLVAHIMSFRDDKAYSSVFPFKQELDGCLVEAIKCFGLEAFLLQFPLHIEGGHPTRPYLLPVILKALSDDEKSDDLVFFVAEMLLGLASRVEAMSVTAQDKKKDLEAKLFETIRMQIWTVLPYYGSPIPENMEMGLEMFMPSVLEILKSSKPERHFVCLFLKNLYTSIRRNYMEDTSDTSRLSVLNEAKKPLNRLLTVLCEDFIQRDVEDADSKDVIVALLNIAEAKNISSYFMHLVKSLNQPSNQLLELISLFVPFVQHETSAGPHPFLSMVNGLLSLDHPEISKKIYRVILASLPSIVCDLSFPLQPLLDRICDEQVASKHRMSIFQVLAENNVDFGERLPVVVSEVMFSSREQSEKIRLASFDALIAIARSCHQKALKLGESIGHSLGDNNGPFGQFVMMILAGLAGDTSVLQAASITCMSRVIYEFKDSIESDLISELVQTMVSFIPSTHREVVKAALGFIKVTIVCFGVDHLKQILPEIVSGLFATKHKQHFRLKIKHLLERLIRKCGVALIESLVPETDKKLIQNIKKSKRRAQKKKETSGEFEDLIASEEEEGFSDDDDHMITEFSELDVSKNKSKDRSLMIREDDEVLDFLSNAALSKIGNKSESARQKRETLPLKMKDGKIVVEEDSGQDDEANDMETKRGAEDYYTQAIRGEDSFVRLPNGKIKFMKRKREEVEQAQSDEEMADSRKENVKVDEGISRMLGRQFKAKKAKGDVKKQSGLDPYAYIPLASSIGGSRNKGGAKFKEIVKASKTGADVKVPTKAPDMKYKRRKTNKKHKN